MHSSFSPEHDVDICLLKVINGTVVYSTQLTASNYTSAGGEPFTFMSNSSGAYVMSGNTTAAMIVAADIPIANGVVHIIDRVLANPAANTAAAASAASSYAAAATQTTSSAGGAVVGGSSALGSATPGASGAASSAPASSAMTSVPFSAGVIGSAVAIFAGIFAGATLV